MLGICFDLVNEKYYQMVLGDLWTPTGVLLGFQVTLFSWRLAEERRVGYEGDIPWLTPSDYMNIAGMLTFVFGVYLFPILEITGVMSTKVFFGLGLVLFVGQILGTAAHYQLFNKTKKRVFVWFPKQEKAVLTLFVILSIIYLATALIRL